MVSPGARRTPARLVRALADGRALTRELAADLLTHMPELDADAQQRQLDAWVDEAAAALLALSDALEVRLLELGAAIPVHERDSVRR